jgi:hypothetical protein
MGNSEHRCENQAPIWMEITNAQKFQETSGPKNIQILNLTEFSILKLFFDHNNNGSIIININSLAKDNHEKK